MRSHENQYSLGVHIPRPARCLTQSSKIEYSSQLLSYTCTQFPSTLHSWKQHWISAYTITSTVHHPPLPIISWAPHCPECHPPQCSRSAYPSLKPVPRLVRKPHGTRMCRASATVRSRCTVALVCIICRNCKHTNWSVCVLWSRSIMQKVSQWSEIALTLQLRFSKEGSTVWWEWSPNPNPKLYQPSTSPRRMNALYNMQLSLVLTYSVYSSSILTLALPLL